MSPDRQALLSLYHDDATALLDRALQAQHEPEGLHVVHAALVEALADAHTDGREPGVSTTVPDETIQAIRARADHSAALPDVTDEHESPADCRRCHTSLHLLDGCEWPADGPLCGTCTDDERLEAIADRAALLTEVRRLTGSPARLEGYDALRGELALQKRATNVAIGERGALQAIRAYLDAVVTQPGRDDFPEWHALADEDRDRLQAWGDRVCQAGMDAENEATEEAEDAARHAAEQADILLTTIRLALGDNPAGNGWKPPTGVHPVVDLALTVSGERDGAVAALATARLDGARVMRDDIADRLADSDIAPFALVAEIRAIDPAAVVGSGSSIHAALPSPDTYQWSATGPNGCLLLSPADCIVARIDRDGTGWRPQIPGRGPLKWAADFPSAVRQVREVLGDVVPDGSAVVGSGS